MNYKWDSVQIPAVSSTLRSCFFLFKNSNPQIYRCKISLANYKSNVTTTNMSKKSQTHLLSKTCNLPPPPPPLFWLLPKNIIPENQTEVNYTKENIILLLSENKFSISDSKIYIIVHVVPIVDCMTPQNLFRPLKKHWHPFSQPSVQMNGDLPSTEAKNRIKKYFSMPQLGTQKGVILKSHLRHQGLWEINSMQSHQHCWCCFRNKIGRLKEGKNF